MNDNNGSILGKPARRPPWNKGKLIGAKPPLRQGHVWSIRTRLQLEKRIRHRAFPFSRSSRIKRRFAFGRHFVLIEFQTGANFALSMLLVRTELCNFGAAGGCHWSLLCLC